SWLEEGNHAVRAPTRSRASRNLCVMRAPMRAARYITLPFLLGAMACASSPREPQEPQTATQPPATTPAPATEPAQEPATADAQETQTAAPAEDPLAEERAQMRAAAEEELARWTPELREQAAA